MASSPLREQPLAPARATPGVDRPRLTSRERLAQWVALQVTVDVAMLVIAAPFSFRPLLAPSPAPPLPSWYVMFATLVIGLLALRGFYRPRLRLQALDDLRSLAGVAAAAAMVLITARVLLGADAYTSWTVRYWLFATAWLGVAHAVLGVAQSRDRLRGEAVRPTLIVGAGKMGHLIARRLLDRPELGLRPVGFLDKEPLDVGERSVPLPVLGASWDLDDIISEHDVQHVIVTFSTAPHHVLLALARRCRQRGVSVSMVPRLFEVGRRRVTVEHLGGVPLVSVDPADPRGWQFELKYALDRLIAAALLIVMLPLLLAVAGAIRLRMGSPIFYRQKRVGRDGRQFEMLKFRTMKGDPALAGEADVAWAVEQIRASGGDPAGLVITAAAPPASIDDRRTRLGRLLRFFSLDELPQLVNVLRGDMSLVGPRPERTTYVRRFETAVYRYGDRHRVKSGVTGWAQVNGLRGETSLADRVEWDNFYVENWSPWLDLKIVLLTAWCLLRGQHKDQSFS